MKRIVSFIMTVILLQSFTACGQKKSELINKENSPVKYENTGLAVRSDCSEIPFEYTLTDAQVEEGFLAALEAAKLPSAFDESVYQHLASCYDIYKAT